MDSRRRQGLFSVREEVILSTKRVRLYLLSCFSSPSVRTPFGMVEWCRGHPRLEVQRKSTKGPGRGRTFHSPETTSPDSLRKRPGSGVPGYMTRLPSLYHCQTRIDDLYDFSEGKFRRDTVRGRQEGLVVSDPSPTLVSGLDR